MSYPQQGRGTYFPRLGYNRPYTIAPLRTKIRVLPLINSLAYELKLQRSYTIKIVDILDGSPMGFGATVPDGVFWKILIVSTTLVADATVLNRVLNLVFTSPQVPLNLWISNATPVITASQVRKVFYTAGYAILEAAFDSANTIRIFTPPDLWPSGTQLSVTSSGAGPGDILTANQIRIEEYA